jgi:hypothetical protein
MRRYITIITLISLSLLGFGLLSQVTPSGYTRIELTEEGRGEKILSVVVPDGEPVTLTTARPKLYEILFCKSAETFYLALDKLRY